MNLNQKGEIMILKKLSILLASFVLSFSSFAVGVGDDAPCVILNDVQTDGTSVEQCLRTRTNGKDYLLLEFFSINCSTCKKNLPILSKLASEVDHLADTRIVSVDRNEKAVFDYIANNQEVINFPVALDSGRDAMKAYKARRTPTLFVLDKNEKVIYRHSGLLKSKDLNKIKSLLK